MTIVREDKPVLYRWYEPYFDRARDRVQPTYYRVKESEAMALAVKVAWIMGVLTWGFVKLTFRLTKIMIVASCFVGFGVFYIFAIFALGGSDKMTSRR